MQNNVTPNRAIHEFLRFLSAAYFKILILNDVIAMVNHTVTFLVPWLDELIPGVQKD